MSPNCVGLSLKSFFTHVDLGFNCHLGFFLLAASMMYQYFVKIVPTIYVKTDGEVSE